MQQNKLLFKDFKMPSKTKVFEIDECDSNHGRFILAPFERGYGVTIANSLRRTLLSSIQGYAITAMRVEYTPKGKESQIVQLTNEFEPIEGMLEDTLHFIQNLKKVRLKVMDESPNATISLEKKGTKGGDYILRAKDLEVNSNIKVFNPELYLATLNEDCDIAIELQIDHGRGYVPSEKNIEYTNTIGVVAVDAIFSPILKVNFEVESYRVIQRTDYEKITLEVWTDGTIRPDDAVSNAARILREYYGYFINVEIEEDEEEEPPQVQEKKEKEESDSKSIEDLHLSVRSSNCLKAANINTLGELKEKTADELGKIKNLGKKSLDEIKEKLREFGHSIEDVEIDD